MTRFDHTRLARSHVVEVDGTRTHYLEGGEGPTLVLLHDGGFGASAEGCWYRNFDAFASGFHVVAPDCRGFGETAKLYDFEGGRARRLWHMTRFLEVMEIQRAASRGSRSGPPVSAGLATGERNWPLTAAVAISRGGFMPDNEARRSMCAKS